MKFSKSWVSKVILLSLLILAACGNPATNELPTQAPIASIKEEDTQETTDSEADEVVTEVVEDNNSEETETSEDNSGEDTAVEAPETNDSEETDTTETEELEINDDELIPIPSLDQSQVGNSSPTAGIGGGGGGIATESAALGATQDLAIDYVGVDIFEDTEFILASDLPTDPARAQVQRQDSFSITLDEARAIAAQFGFNGPIYQQPAPEGVEVIEENVYQNVYFAFDDNGGTLNIDSFGIYYNNSSYQFESIPNLTLEEAAPIAEAFLQERGLLDFEYIIEKGWGNEIWFKRVIRGAVVNQPELTVSVTNEGDVLFASMQRFASLERLGNYPLRSAADAWAELQGGVTENAIPFSYVPNFDDFPVAPETPFEDEYQYWQRTYAPGSTATIFTWPNIFNAVDGNTPPRIEAYPFTLTGDPADLEAIASQAFNQFRFVGEVGENGRTLNVTSWEAITDYPENLYLQGTVIFEEGQTLFVTDAGDTYIVPDAPADLPEGERLNIFAWEARSTDGPFAELAWENIDVFINYDEVLIEEPTTLEEVEIFEPTVYETMTINAVELVYFFAYIFPEFDAEDPVYGPPTTLIKPVWQFTGEADNGDLINFYVDAVAEEFIN